MRNAQQTYTNVPHPHSLLSLLGTEGFSTKGSLFAVVQISFPMCSESVLFHFPSIPAPLYRHTYPVLSMKSKFTFSRLPQVLAGGQSLCSLLQQKFMKGFPTFNISLPYPQFTIQPAQKCVITVLPGRKSYKCQQVNSHLSRHSSYSVIINTPCFWLPGLYSGVYLCLGHPFLSRLVPVSYPLFTVVVLQGSLYHPHPPMLFLLVSQLQGDLLTDAPSMYSYHFLSSSFNQLEMPTEPTSIPGL